MHQFARAIQDAAFQVHDLGRPSRSNWQATLVKTEVTPQKEEVPEKEGSETLPDSPLLDLSDAAVKKLIRSAKKRGYVTHDQINSVLPSEEVNSEQIEDVLAMFSEMGARQRSLQAGERLRDEDRSTTSS
jgi:hypothetical protein